MLVLAAALALTGCGIVSKPARPAPSTPAGTSSAPPDATGIPDQRPSSQPPGHDDNPIPPPPPAAAAADVAARFAAAWARPDLPAAQWYAGVTPLCEPYFAEQLRTVDPANIPARHITGRPVPAPGKPTVYSVPTDAGTLTVTVGPVGGAWRVVSNDFTRSTR